MNNKYLFTKNYGVVIIVKYIYIRDELRFSYQLKRYIKNLL